MVVSLCVGVCVCVCVWYTTSVCVCVPRNLFESAPTARFNNPKVLPLLQTMCVCVCVCVCDAQIIQILHKLRGSAPKSYC